MPRRDNGDVVIRRTDNARTDGNYVRQRGTPERNCVVVRAAGWETSRRALFTGARQSRQRIILYGVHRQPRLPFSCAVTTTPVPSNTDGDHDGTGQSAVRRVVGKTKTARFLMRSVGGANRKSNSCPIGIIGHCCYA